MRGWVRYLVVSASVIYCAHANLHALHTLLTYCYRTTIVSLSPSTVSFGTDITLVVRCGEPHVSSVFKLLAVQGFVERTSTSTSVSSRRPAGSHAHTHALLQYGAPAPAQPQPHAVAGRMQRVQATSRLPARGKQRALRTLQHHNRRATTRNGDGTARMRRMSNTAHVHAIRVVCAVLGMLHRQPRDAQQPNRTPALRRVRPRANVRVRSQLREVRFVQLHHKRRRAARCRATRGNARGRGRYK